MISLPTTAADSFENVFVKAYYYAEYSLVVYHWQSANATMQYEEYKQTMLHILALVRQHNPTQVIADFRESEFIIVPELQVWLSDSIVKPAVEAGMRKLFFIAHPSDLIQELSLEQILDEAQEHEFQRFILRDINVALQFVATKVSTL